MLIDIKTAARELKCSPGHIRRMIKRGAWPAYRLGPGAIRVDPEEVRRITRFQVSKTGEQGLAGK